MINNLRVLHKRIAELEKRVAGLEDGQTRPRKSTIVKLMIDGKKLGEEVIT